MEVLMIDDEAKLREKMGKYLTLKGHEFIEAGTGEEGLALLKEKSADLVLLDLRMPGMDGLTCLERIKSSGWRGDVIMISAHGEIRDAVEAMKLGAYDYLTKPFYLEELLVKIQQVAEKQRLQETNRYLKDLTHPSIVYASKAMTELMEALQRVSPSDVPVLLTGETGVGKEVVARQIHEMSKRVGSFVAINCGAIPENLLESELFGYEKGAFSGAVQRKLGKIELAQGGTLFLDEIGELPKAMQVKLLRVLQEREMERIGGTRTISLDLRIIAATNRDLLQEIKVGRFREDLYYRLNVITFQIKPLRERTEDIIPLAEHFVAEMNVKLGKRVHRLTDNVRKELVNYPYPGNVRELRNLIERSMILSQGDELVLYHEAGVGSEIAEVAHELPTPVKGKQSDGEQILTLNELEAARIAEALRKHHGNRTHAAVELGISRRTIINKIKLYGLE